MDHTRFKNKSLGNITLQSKLAHNKQIDFCLSLIGKAKMDYYNNRNQKAVTDKLFWNTKPFFSDKRARSQKITLIEENRIIYAEISLINIFNKYFSSKCSVNIPRYEDRTDLLRKKFKYYPSILVILGKV